MTWNLGNSASLTFYGYIKADLIGDDGYALGATTAPLKDIGLAFGPKTGRSETSQLNETRFGFDLRVNELLSGRFEYDFFGPDNEVRLRLGYLAIGPVVVGQNWSNFVSLETLPSTVDFQGPPSVPSVRVPQVRYDWSPSPDLTVSASIEEDVSNSDDVAFTLSARYGFPNGIVRLSALSRDTSIGDTPIHGWGVNFAAALESWEGGQVLGSYAIGKGVTDYFAAGLSGPAVYKDGRENSAQGVTLSLSQKITDRLSAAFTAGWLGIGRAEGPETRRLETLHVSAFYALYNRTTLMGEYFRGWRKDGAGNLLDSDRMQISVKWAF